MEKVQKYSIWFVTTLFVVYSFCLSTASAVFSDAIKITLHTNSVGASMATGAFILGFALMQIPAGYLLDKFNARFVVSSGVLILALGNLLTSYSHTLLIYSLSNFLQGIGASFAFIAAAVLISQWFAEKIFPIMFGLTQTISCILAGIIHYYFTLMLTNHTWNEIYRCIAGGGFLLLVLTFLVVKSPKSQQAEAGLSLKKALRSVLKNKQIILSSIAAATSFGVLLAYAGLWYNKVQTYYSIDNLNAVAIGGMIFFGIGIGTPLLGWVSNIVKSRLMVIHITLCLGTMALLVGIYSPHFSVNTLIMSHIFSFLIGFFLSGAMLFYTIVSESSPHQVRGVAISVTNTAVFVFNTLMLFIPYLFMTNLSTNFYTYLWVLPFFILFSILLLYFIKDSAPSYDKKDTHE